MTPTGWLLAVILAAVVFYELGRLLERWRVRRVLAALEAEVLDRLDAR